MGDEAHAPSWSAEGLLQVIDSSLDPLVVSDAQGVIQIASRSAASVFGWEREELVGQSVNILMTGADASQHGAFLAQYRETGVPRIIGRPRTVVGQRRNGEEFPCEICINRVDVPHEPRLHFVAVLRDIALRQRVEDRWRALVDAAPAEILTVGSDLRLRSSGASEEAGAEVRPDEELFAESERQRVRSWIRKALESGEHSSIECRAAGPPADRRISCQIQPLTRRGGSDEAVLVLTDVTELRRAQRASR